jgi:hypothetical protein
VVTAVSTGPRRSAATRIGALAALVSCAFLAAALHRAADDAPIAVRFPEGMLHGFLVLKKEDGTIIARGDLLQVPRKGHIDSRMVFRFTDGSLLDERVVFSQNKVFTVHEYRWIQRGPAFTEDAEAHFERASRKYRVQTTDRDDGDVDVTEGDLDEMPASLSNGMVIVLAKNLPPGQGATVRMVAFTPSPKLIGLELEPEGTERVSFGPETKPVTRYAIKPKLGFFLKVGAKLTGRDPPDSHAWIITEDVPAFAKFVGPLTMGGTGPIWRVEVTAPTWTSEQVKR